MARKVQVLLVDDLDGTDLGTDGETVAFGLGGERYEIDLSHGNAEKLRNVLGQYVKAGRNVTRSGGGSRPTGRRSSGGGGRGLDREQSNAVRMWARKNGWPQLAERGRIPSEVIEAFNAGQARQMPLPSSGAATEKPAAKDDGNSTKAAKPAAEKKVPATV